MVLFFKNVYAQKQFTWKFSLEEIKNMKEHQHKYTMHTLIVAILNVS